MKLTAVRTVAPASVRQPTLKGHQLVAALWFPADWFDEAERARRVLGHWRAGASVLRFDQGDLLRFASEFEHECSTLGGWPLCKRGRALCSAPLADAELASMPCADVWIVHGGQVTALDLQAGRALDPAEWISIGALALHETYDCRAAMPEPVALAPADARDVREVLNGRIPPASQEQREFLRALAERGPAGKAGAKAGASRHGFRLPSTATTLKVSFALAAVALLVAVASAMRESGLSLWGLVAVFGLLGFLRRLFGADTRWSSAGDSVGRVASPSPPFAGIQSRRQGSARPQAWRRWLARMAVTSQMSRLLGRRQAAYMRQMLGLFDEGKLDEALRHAIPLGSASQSLGQAFGTPGRRDNLSLTRQPGLAVSIHLGEDLDAHLRRVYRQAFDKLDRERRIDEAVFVLAELLEARQEALDYLERHGRFEQAAELALAWDRPADVIVRLHCLAGDWRRAVAVARRDNAFANAVLQLERKWPDAAAKLREEWAQALAAQGDWLGAVEAIWPLAGRRALATDWLLGAEAHGGILGARALVKRAILLPDTLSDCAARLEDLRDDPACHLQRAAIARALLALKQRHPRARQLARIVAPAVLADQGAGRGQLARSDLQRLITLADDSWLNADMPGKPLPEAGSQDLLLGKVPLEGQIPDAGSFAICDAVALQDGQYLVALGEAGAVIADAHGRVVSRFAVPAQRIVIAHSRQVALLMALRDRVWRVCRLDLVSRRVADLGMAELEHVAMEFDGIAWTVAGGQRLRVLDTQHSLHEVLWQVTDLPGPVHGLSVNARVEQVVLQGDGGVPEVWRYSLPQRRLLARAEAVPERSAQDSVQLLNPDGGVIEVWRTNDAHGSTSICYRLHNRNVSIPWPHITAEGMPLEAQAAGGWLLVGLGDEAAIHWCVIALTTGRIHAGIEWPAPAMPQARLSDGDCLLFDTQGRLWSLNMATSAMNSLSLA